MKRIFLVRRLGAVALAALMLISLCACSNEPTTTTTTVGDDVTTTVGDDVTTTVGDDVTTTVVDGETTTVPGGETTTVVDGETTTVPGGETTTVVDGETTTVGKGTTKKPTTVNKTTSTVGKTTTTRNRPWGDETTTRNRPWGDDATTTTSATTSTTKQYATLPNIQRDPKYDNPYGVYHTLLGYTSPENGAFSKSTWLPSVGYIKNKQIQGVMYDSFIILPSPGELLYGNSFTTKSGWDKWRRHTYKNLDTLNQAVAEVQEALNLKEYKVKVFLSIWKPESDRHGNWGKLSNGTALGAKNDDECFAMVKYMVDSYVAEMKEKNYSNVELAGFYWFDEALDSKKADWYKRVFSYVKSVDLITVWSPYYLASGWNQGLNYGIDLVAMQSNHFHSTPVGTMNSGSVARLEANAKRVMRKETSGVNIECSVWEDVDDITTIKMTMAAALKYGTDSAYHMYYFGAGVRAAYGMSRSDDEYIRSAYDDLYKYMNHTLKSEDLWIREFEKEQPWPDGIQDYL